MINSEIDSIQKDFKRIFFEKGPFNLTVEDEKLINKVSSLRN